MSIALLLPLTTTAEAEAAVTLLIEPRAATAGATEVLFDIYIDPGGTKEIGVFQFSVSGEGCTITGEVYRNSDLAFDEQTGKGAFAQYGGTLRDGVYTFAAGGTARKSYTMNGTTYPAHIWNAAGKTRIVTLKVSVAPNTGTCRLVAAESGDRRFTAGNAGSADGSRLRYAVQVDSRAFVPGADMPGAQISGMVTTSVEYAVISLLKGSSVVERAEMQTDGSFLLNQRVTEGGDFLLRVESNGCIPWEMPLLPPDDGEALSVTCLLLRTGDVNGDGTGWENSIRCALDMQALYEYLSMHIYPDRFRDTGDAAQDALLKAYFSRIADINGSSAIDILDYQRLYMLASEVE